MISPDPIDGSRQKSALFRSALRRAVQGMGQSAPVQLLSIASIAVSMLLLGLSVLVWVNTQQILQGWGGDVPVTIYVHDGVEPARVQDLRSRVTRVPFVVRVDHVAPEEAVERLAAGLGGDPTGLEGLDAALFPDSLEVRWRADTPPSAREALVEELRRTAEIEEVVATGDWLQRAEDLVDTLRAVVLGLGTLVSLSCLAIVRATIRLGVLSRRGELEILGLVGGTRAYVSAPFMIEGLIQGIIGTGLALALLWIGFAMARPTLDAGLGLILAGGNVRFLSVLEGLAGLGLGGLLGVIGSRAAVVRYIEP